MSKESLHELGRCNYKIYQRDDTFCFGVDSVLLSWFTKVKKEEKVIDLGTGTGVILLLLKARTEGTYFYGIDIIKESVNLARKSVKLNGLEPYIKIDEMDIKRCWSHIKEKFDVVVTNPPYMVEAGNSKNSKITCVNKEENLYIARHEVKCTIEDVIESSSKLLNSKGRFYIVYKPDRLASLFYEMRRFKIEPKKVLFVQPSKNKEANIVLVEGVRDGKEGLKVLKPLIIYDDNGNYTTELYDIYNK